MRQLAIADIGGVAALYRDVFERSPYGHLGRRTPQDFERILSTSSITAGIIVDGKLMAYQLWEALSDIAIDPVRFRACAEMAAGDGVLFNKGTVVDPMLQGQGLAMRLEKYTSGLARAAGYRRRMAQVYFDNYAALRPFVSVDRSVVGLATDEFGVNFITGTFLAGTEVRRKQGWCLAGDLQRLESILATQRCFATRGRGSGLKLIHGDVTEVVDSA
jgi:GNAT superfamily N-acetyltransferase